MDEAIEDTYLDRLQRENLRLSQELRLAEDAAGTLEAGIRDLAAERDRLARRVSFLSSLCIRAVAEGWTVEEVTAEVTKGTADNEEGPRCIHDLQHPHTTVAVTGDDFQKASCVTCGREWINDLRTSASATAILDKGRG